MRTPLYRLLATLFLCQCVLATALLAQTVKVSSRFDPARVVEGQAAEYIIVVEGAVDANIQGNFPEVEGLSVDTTPSRSLQQAWQNGNALTTQTYSFRTTASRTGTFTVPEWRIVINGRSHVVPEANLEVTEQNVLFLSLEMPEEPVYPGQIVNVLLQLDASNSLRGLSRNGNFGFESDSLLMEVDPENPSRSEVNRNGESFTRYSFRGRMTTTHAGKAELTVTLPMAVTTNRSSRSNMPGFNSMFQTTTQVPFLVSTGKVEINVSPFPSGAPSGFNGAVGNFTGMEVMAQPREVNVGDPISLTLRLSGGGNFPQLSAPQMELPASIQSYPPRSRFIPQAGTDSTTRGTMEVEYILRPMDNTVKELPGIPFVFFDPASKEYVDLSSSAIPIKVSGTGSSSSPVPAEVSDEASMTEAETPELSQRVPILLDTGFVYKGMTPVFRSPLFLGMQVIPLLVFGGCFLWLRHRRRMAEDVEYRRHVMVSRLSIRLSRQAGKAARRGDLEGFLSNGTQAFSSLFCWERDVVPSSVTWFDFKEWAEGKNIPEDHLEYIGQLYNGLEESHYAGKTIDLSAMTERFEPVFNATRKTAIKCARF